MISNISPQPSTEIRLRKYGDLCYITVFTVGVGSSVSSKLYILAFYSVRLSLGSIIVVS